MGISIYVATDLTNKGGEAALGWGRDLSLVDSGHILQRPIENMHIEAPTFLNPASFYVLSPEGWDGNQTLGTFPWWSI